MEEQPRALPLPLAALECPVPSRGRCGSNAIAGDGVVVVSRYVVLVVVLVCTMPELLMRQVSLMMASSRVMTLVVTLLFVITAGIYLLRLSLLSDVLILASAVLLARLDLTRAGALPPPLPSMYLLAFVVFAGIGVGHLLPNHTAGWFAEVLIST